MPSETPVQPAYFSRQVTDARRWFLTRPQAGRRGLMIESVGCERCLPDYAVQRDTFDAQCVELVAEGKGTVRLDGRTHSLRPGVVFTYGPGVAHRIENHSASPMLKYFVDYGGSKAAALAKEHGLGGGTCVQVTDLHEVAELFELLIKNATAETGESLHICGLLIEAILCKVAEKQIPRGGADYRAIATYQRARNHIRENFLEVKSVAQVAAACHVNAAYLSRLFQRFDRLSPYQYLLRLKMSRAASLLLLPGKLVKEVAEEMNFTDVFHFSRSFKSVYGMSPERFMERGRKR